jgi:hypothetical protein
MHRSLLFSAAVLLAASTALAGTTGNIRGVVVDAETLEPLPGVTVIAVSPAMQGEEATLTDELGRYALSGLPPGVYTMRFVFAGATAERHDVVVAVDRTITVNTDLSSAAATAEVYTIEQKAPSVETSSSAIGVTITKDFIQNVPQGRTRNFDGALDVLPSATSDEYGTSIGGATSPENAYVIDGLNTTDPAYGLLGSRLVLDFVEEFDIKEGGYAAEYGRATGGFVNIVTKSGGNELHGSVFVYYRPGFLQAPAKRIERAGESIATRRFLEYYLNPGFEVGGPIMVDKLWFHVGYAPELMADTWRRSIRARQEDPNGDGPLLDVNGDPVTKKIAYTEHESFAIAHHFTAKLTHLIDADNRHSLSLHGAPSTFEGARQNDLDENTPVISLNGDTDTFGFNETAGSYDGVYKYAGKFMNDKLQLELWLGWHHQEAIFRPTADIDDKPLIVYTEERNLRDVQAEVPGECRVENDFDDGTSRCVVQNYGANGFGQGLVQTAIQDRWIERLGSTHLFDFAGLHQVKWGIDFEQNYYYDRRWYTGGGFYYHEPDYADFYGQEFFKDDLDTVAKSLAGRSAHRNYAVFLQDSWNPMPSLTLNYGVRWEAQELYGINPKDRKGDLEKKFGIYDNVAPRLGGTWDFLGDGRSRLFVHWGRFYESIPVDISDRSFAGEGLRISFYDNSSCTDADGNPIDGQDVTNPHEQCPELGVIPLGGEDSLVAPGLKGQYSDEALLGFDVEVMPSWVVGITGIYRDLGRVIEDVSTDGGETYMFANPGQFDKNELDELDRQIARESDPEKRERLQTLRDHASHINDYPEATRTFFGLQFTLDKKFADSFLVRGSYLLSWLYGNYPGLYSDHNLQLDPNVTTQYDLVSLLTNRTGYLSNDRRHRFKLDGYYMQNVADTPLGLPVYVVLGASFRLTSGKPIEALGADPSYGRDEAFLLPRGEGGRTPWQWAIDTHLGFKYNVDEHLGAELFADVFNATNNQEVDAVDETYTYSYVNPIVNGSEKDLEHARDINGDPVVKNPNYKKPVRYQAPVSGQLGLRLYF